MAVKFFNIRSALTAVADTEPKIAALWSSSDHSPNITQGQDMGWRLAPEVVVEMKRIKQDYEMLEKIAQRYRKSLEDVGEIDILHWISDKTQPERAPVAEIADYQDEYDAAVRALELKGKEGSTTTTTTEPPTTTTTTTEKK